MLCRLFFIGFLACSPVIGGPLDRCPFEELTPEAPLSGGRVARPDSAAWPKDAPNPTFGPELTFDRGARSEAETFARLHAAFAARAEAGGFTVGKQGDLAPSEQGDFMFIHAFVVSFPGENRFSPIRVVVKPDGKAKPVIEVSASPRSYREYDGKARPAMEAVFKLMGELGHKPREDEAGGGHVHMGIESAFGRDPRLFRNFLVDTLWNHPELHWPFLRRRRTSEARTLAEMGPKYQAEFKKIIAEYDAALEANRIVGPWWLRQAIFERILKPAVEDGTLSKSNNLAVNLHAEVETVELRSVRPQSSENELFLVYSLLAHRVKYLKEKGGLVPLKTQTEPASRDEARSNMENYIRESSLSPALYKEFFEKGWGASDSKPAQVDPE